MVNAEKPAVPAAAESDDLPPFPPVATALMSLAAKEEVGLAQVNETISLDAAVSAELLRVANSAFVGVRGDVRSVVQASAILGLKRVAGIAAAVALRQYLGKLWSTSSVRRCWRHNLASALTAEQMARLLNLDAHAAYTAGLLHDVGRFALIVKHQADYLRLLQTAPGDDGDLRVIERDRFGMDHGEAGRLVIEKLGLSDSLSDVAALHHDPPPNSSAEAVALVHVACELATSMGFSVRPANGDATVPDLDAILAVLPKSYREPLVKRHQFLHDTVTVLVDAYDRALI
jgi:putative nucleotidyltransferase with HDIG domain